MLHSVANLLQYLCAKNYQNTMRFDKVIAKIKGCSFLPHSLEWFGYPTVKTFDYCNSALAGVARVYFQKLQSVQNMDARVVSGVRRSKHITPVLEDLYWLPVSQRVVFKTALMV